jgi:hypothetical protein
MPMLDHITRIVQDYLQQEAIELLPWSAMSPDIKPIKHLWDYLGRGTTNERRIWSRYFCPLKVPSMTYKSILQIREKHPQTVKPPPPNAVVPTICSCWNVVFLGLQLGTALVQGWQQYPQHRLRRLIHGIRRRFHELYRMRGGYTRYWLYFE